MTKKNPTGCDCPGNIENRHLLTCERGKPDLIKRPNHYTWHPRIACNPVVAEFPYNLGTAIAYIWRCDHKGTPIDDLEKAVQHLEMEIERRKAGLSESDPTKPPR